MKHVKDLLILVLLGIILLAVLKNMGTNTPYPPQPPAAPVPQVDLQATIDYIEYVNALSSPQPVEPTAVPQAHQPAEPATMPQAAPTAEVLTVPDILPALTDPLVDGKTEQEWAEDIAAVSDNLDKANALYEKCIIEAAVAFANRDPAVDCTAAVNYKANMENIFASLKQDYSDAKARQIGAMQP